MKGFNQLSLILLLALAWIYPSAYAAKFGCTDPLIQSRLDKYFLVEDRVSDLLNYARWSRKKFDDQFKEWSDRFHEIYGAIGEENETMFRGMALTPSEIDYALKNGLKRERTFEAKVFMTEFAKIAFTYLLTSGNETRVGVMAVLDSQGLDLTYNKNHEYYSKRNIPKNRIKALWILDPHGPKSFPFVLYYSKEAFPPSTQP